MSFKNKVVIVTGSSSGIGAATAIKFSSEGAHVVLVARNEAKLTEVAKKCKNPLIIPADVAKDEDVRKIVDETIKKFGQIDVLVNNAGTAQGTSSLTAINMEGYDQIMAVNLRAAVHLTGLAVPHLIKSKGNVINISSVVGKIPSSHPSFSFYCITKAGMDHFTVCAAAELGKHGIRVNTISPGPVITNFMNYNNDIKVDWDVAKKITVLNRVSQPEEVADLVIFVASDKAKAITGSDFVTDNGVLVKRS